MRCEDPAGRFRGRRDPRPPCPRGGGRSRVLSLVCGIPLRHALEREAPGSGSFLPERSHSLHDTVSWVRSGSRRFPGAGSRLARMALRLGTSCLLPLDAALLLSCCSVFVAQPLPALLLCCSSWWQLFDCENEVIVLNSIRNKPS